MAEMTGIGWCDSTANLWIGCSKVSAACDHCYAEDLMGTEGSRLKRVPWGPKGDRLYCKQGWSDLRKWQRQAAANDNVDPKLGRRRFVFINSLSDFFDNHKSVVWRAAAWDLFRECTNLVIILVTKRPQLIARELPDFWAEIAHRVYIVVTAEDQANADLRVEKLFDTFRDRPEPGVLGVSIEPMLGPVDLTAIGDDGTGCRDALAGLIFCQGRNEPVSGPRLRWVIVGGESGDKARPTHPAWVLALRDQCAAAGVAFFFKQWGTWLPDGVWIDKQAPYAAIEQPGTDGGKDKVLWPDGHFGAGSAEDHGGPGVGFDFESKAERLRVIDPMPAFGWDKPMRPDHMIHGRYHQEFPDERMAA